MTKIFTGIVVSDKMTKTIVVDVQRRFQHPKYRKIVNAHKKIKVHVDEDGLVKIGDVVKIIKTRPISKDKHFALYTGKSSVQPEEKRVEVKVETQAEIAAEKPATKPKTEKKVVAKKPTEVKTATKKTPVKKSSVTKK